MRAAVSRPARRGLPGPAHPGHTRTDYQPDPWATTAPARLLAPDREGQSPVWGPAAVTVLIETARRWPHIARDQLCPLLHTQPHLVLAAGGVALARLVELPTVDPGALEAIEALLPPGRHVELDIAAAALTTRLTTHRLTTTTDPADRARLYATLGYRLAHAGQWGQAVTATTDALEIHRRLAQTNPAAFEPNLATVLNNLGLWLSNLGRREEALTATTEAVEIRRRLAQANPAAFGPDLARGLWAFAWVRVAGHIELPQALTAAKESTTRYEGLVQQLPQAFTDDLYGALATLADVLDGLDRSAEAADVRRRIGG